MNYFLTSLTEIIPIVFAMYLFYFKTESLWKNKEYIKYFFFLLTSLGLFYFITLTLKTNTKIGTFLIPFIWLLSTFMFDLIHQKFILNKKLKFTKCIDFNDTDHLILVSFDDSGLIFDESNKRNVTKIDIGFSLANGLFIVLSSYLELMILA